MAKLSDFDRRAKVRHFDDQPHTYTVSQVGLVREQNPDKVQLLAGEPLRDNDFISVPYLWFREWGTQRSFRLNTTNIIFLEERGIKDAKDLQECKITVQRQSRMNFGRKQDMLCITNIEFPKNRRDDMPYRTERLNQLKQMRETERELLHSQGIEPETLTQNAIAKMTTAEIEQLIARTEQRIAEFKPTPLRNRGT